MTSRIDPITETEWKRLRSQLGPIMDEKAFGSESYRHTAKARYGWIMDFLWETGAHPSVFANPGKNNVQLKDDTMVWRRPKTKRVCVMPLSRLTALELRDYLAEGPYYTTRSILRVMRECADRAGLKDVTPKTIRHSVAYDLFRKHGPSVAKESLGVSDKVLQDYMAMSADTRVRVIREGREATKVAEATK